MRDLRYAARQLRKSPGFTLTVLATLALCIGANTAIYSVVDAVLLRPAPYPHPERLGMVAWTVRSTGGEWTSYGVNGAMWESVRDNATAVDAAAFSRGTKGVNLVAGGAVQFVKQQRVAAGYFRVLGIAPLQGREFSRAEDSPGGPPVAVLSYGLWQRLFQNEAAPGKTVLLRGEPFTVVGVMPESFRTESPADLWTPLRATRTGEGSGINYGIIARLKPEAGWPGASAQLEMLMNPVFAAMHQRQGSVAKAYLEPLQTGLTAGFRNTLLLMWASVAVVLLIGCVNIGGLLLARAGTRTREVATRLAVGGSRNAIVRQLLMESLLLSLGGGLLAVPIGKVALHGLLALGLQRFNMWYAVELNARVLAATLVLAAGTSLLFGLAPALATTRVDLRAVLVEGGRGLVGGRRTWGRQSLVAAEVALSLVLLVGAGLLLRTLAYLDALKPGFDPHNLVTAQISLQDARYSTSERVNQLFNQSLQRIRNLPGVEGAAVGLTLPYQRPLNDGFRLPGGKTQGADVVIVTPGFFETLRIPLIEGRTFADSDRAPVAVINQTFARKFLRGRNAVDADLLMGTASRRIVGVVQDTQQTSGLGNYGPLGASPTIYLLASQTSNATMQLVNTWFSFNWIVRTRTSIADLAREMQKTVDPQLPFNGFKPMEDVQVSALQEQRYQAAIFTVMAGLALLLAAIGLYGTIAHSVTERTREMGIRMALGATTSRAIGSVAGPGIRLAVIGIVAGAVIASFAAKLLKSLLWGVPATDPLTFAIVAMVLLGVALLASLLPALRLLRLDPAVTLRAE